MHRLYDKSKQGMILADTESSLLWPFVAAALPNEMHFSHIHICYVTDA